MYTEEEAKTKECKLEQFGIGLAMIAIAYAKAHGAGDDPPPVPNGMCIASRCMKWRNITIREEGLIEHQGYCGLAGKP